MNTKNIIISAYPKSGNTWLSRLTAELVQCPFKGYWLTDDLEMNKEEMNRVSEYVCFKSHHQLNEIRKKTEQPWKIIYLVRDPRDVLFSGMPYFLAAYRKRTEPAILRYLFPHFVYWRLGGKGRMKRAMMNALLRGERKVNHWCRVSWSDHVSPYIDSQEILTIKYEALLEKPEETCQSLLRFLGITRTVEEIRAAIDRQSFDAVKQKLRMEGLRPKVKLMRKGQQGYWKSQLSDSEKQEFIQCCERELRLLGYSFL